MKIKTSLLLIFMFVGATCFAQTKAKMDSWKELKEFHEVMAATYHPSQENDLKPIKARATELKEKAIALSNGNMPAEFNNEKVKDSIKMLQGQCNTLEKMVKNNTPDVDISKFLNKAHNTFHDIVGLCSGGEGHEKEEHSK